MGLFQEYLNSKSQIEKPKVSVTGDFTDPMTPPDAPKDGKPYGVSDGKKLKTNKEKGFGDQGDSKLKYEPKVDNTSSATAAKIPTAESAELCAILIDAIKKDPTVAEQMVSQIKRSGLLGVLVAEMLQYKETYSHLAEVMAHTEYGPPVCNKLVRAMSEEVAPPFSASLEGDEEEEEEPDEFAADDDSEDGNTDPNASADPLMGAVPQGAAAMKHFQRAMMRK